METMNLDELDVEFASAVIEEGALAGYVEVFPWAEAPEFTLDGVRWLVDDQYCVQPGCNCREAVLAFCRLGGGSTPTRAPTKCAVFLRHNYVNGKTEVEKAHSRSPTAEQLMQALRAAHPQLAETLRQRHGQLQQLGRRLLGETRRRLIACPPPLFTTAIRKSEIRNQKSQIGLCT
jgi:hypothetical protein